MKRLYADRILLAISTSGFLLMSVSFAVMPFDTLGFLPGILFWSGLLVGTVFQIILEVRRRAFFTSYGVNRKNMQKPRNGLLSFQSNMAARIVDYTVAASFLATVLALILTNGVGYICYVLIAITVFSFCLHCILNGRIYFHAKNQDRVRCVLESRKRENKKGEGKYE